MQRIHRGLASVVLPKPRCVAERIRGSQRTFAVTEAPSRKASSREEMVVGGPPIFVKRWVRRMPGRRREGETKMIFWEG